MKTAQERKNELQVVRSNRQIQRDAARQIAERIEPTIDKAIRNGESHLRISRFFIGTIDEHFTIDDSSLIHHDYFSALADVYQEHGFGVHPIQDTGCGFDDVIYWLGFVVFW